MPDTALDFRSDEKSDEYLRRLNIPYSRCQPYIRPLQASSLSSKQHLNPDSIISAPADLTHASETLGSDPSNLRVPDCVTSDGPGVFYGPVQCASSRGCSNSGATKCRWTLCKTCCAKKTENQRKDSTKVFDNDRNTNNADLKEEVCEVHAARAKLELERKAFKAEKRKKKVSMIQERNVKYRSVACPPTMISTESA
ncbi:hypothetical protein CROQUDRAFT_663670 [Cronartium quercuum f. sp. fusiforme G11]|uniref:Uncharacterized protein n=1 Tax=Cronartium quercuum f. sp. fusiforme G11 TaxID=708437 RepID=A0A9P6N8H7_9BASI|nr:hypothetical protein CROQUDRAFT_663670 [Cronartium quercuum f. sp. fusiforme G11]